MSAVKQVPFKEVIGDITDTFNIKNKADLEQKRSTVGKKLRGHIRAGFDGYCQPKVWRQLVEAQKKNRDNSGYPPMPVKLAKSFVSKFGKAAK